MPEATVLYTVTAVVVLGLIVWVAAVLKTARKPWARPAALRLPEAESLAPATSEDEPEGGAKAAEAEVEASEDGARVDADSTAKATPVALASEAKARAAAKDETKDDAEP